MPLTIQDILRECTAEIHEAIRGCEEDIARSTRDLDDARRRVEESSASLSVHQSQISAQQRRVNQLEEALEELKKQLEAKKSELLAAHNDIQRIEGNASKLRKDKRSIQESIEKSDKQLVELQQNKERLAQRLGESHRDALRRYVADVQKRILQLSLEQQEKSAKLAALSALKTARHENKQIGDLLDARDEWKRMIKGAGVPSVRAAAMRELERIEGELNAAFPGALEAEDSVGCDEEIIELFFRHWEKEARTWVFIPFDAALWKSLESDCEHAPDSWAMQLAWSLRKNLDLKWEDTQFQLLPDQKIIVLNTPLSPNIADQSLSATLGASVSAAFIISPLPSIVADSLSYEN